MKIYAYGVFGYKWEFRQNACKSRKNMIYFLGDGEW